MVFSFPSRPSGLRINPRDRGAADQNPEGREVTTRPDSVNRVRPPPSQLPGGTTPGTGWHVPSSAPTPELFLTLKACSGSGRSVTASPTLIRFISVFYLKAEF